MSYILAGDASYWQQTAAPLALQGQSADLCLRPLGPEQSRGSLEEQGLEMASCRGRMCHGSGERTGLISVLRCAGLEQSGRIPYWQHRALFPQGRPGGSRCPQPEATELRSVYPALRGIQPCTTFALCLHVGGTPVPVAFRLTRFTPRRPLLRETAPACHSVECSVAESPGETAASCPSSFISGTHASKQVSSGFLWVTVTANSFLC